MSRGENGSVQARYLESRGALKSDNYREKLSLAFVHHRSLSPSFFRTYKSLSKCTMQFLCRLHLRELLRLAR